ncbi:MAG: flagellar biosynthetic protein FliR [Betaproteobacteria bacterium]|nr:flagellar biosynthetic protein FliR [Betaproteobacteria bacterium]
MNLLAADIVERFYTFLWPMLRISALLLAAPIFSLRALTLRVRVLFALALTWMVYPLYQWPVIDPVSAAGLLEIFNQISIGLVMGLVLQIATAALLVAGQAISNSMGLSIANMIDPNLGNVPVIAQFMLILSTLIFVGLGGHAMLLALLVDSFSSVPIGKPLLSQAVLTQLLAWSSMMFLGAVLISLPVMVALLFINIGLGVTTRAAPSLNIFSLGLPAMIIAGFGVLMVALPSMGNRIQWLWLQGFMQVRNLVELK